MAPARKRPTAPEQRVMLTGTGAGDRDSVPRTSEACPLSSDCPGTATTQNSLLFFLLSFFFFFFFFFLLFRVVSTAHGGSQARGRLGAAAASLCHSHSDAGSEPHLQPIP